MTTKRRIFKEVDTDSKYSIPSIGSDSDSRMSNYDPESPSKNGSGNRSAFDFHDEKSSLLHLNHHTKEIVNDTFSMILLLVLYTLQGIPMGLSASIPLLLKEKNVSYEGLSLFSLVAIPFSLKLIWAPIVDSCYFKSVGRRKTWLIPIQLLTGFVMILGSNDITNWLGDKPAVEPLTIFFTFLYFLMATQDIAVDGWALTMLSRVNVGYASTCNSIGQSLGVFLANQGLIALSDPTWCKNFLGYANDDTAVTLPSFMRLWGYLFIVVTLIVAFIKKEVNHVHDEHEESHGLLETYSQVITIFKLRPVQILTLIQLTNRIGFASVDAASTFKMQEYGMSKTEIATISPVLIFVGLLLPVFTGDIVSRKPIPVLVHSIGFKLFTSILMYFATTSVQGVYQHGHKPDGGYLFYIMTVMVLHEVASNLIFISCMSFFAKISDPKIGGTYMTLLNTITNLGSKWPQSLALWLLPKLTITQCINNRNQGVMILPNNEVCSLLNDTSQCGHLDGKCQLFQDGYTSEMIVCTVLGVIWLVICYFPLSRLEHLPREAWIVSVNQNSHHN